VQTAGVYLGALQGSEQQLRPQVLGDRCHGVERAPEPVVVQERPGHAEQLCDRRR
jgi:hypothetical protein